MVLSFALLLGPLGCGYRFSSGGNLPSGIGNISVRMFDNRTGETSAEAIFTNALIAELIRSGVSVAQADTADSVLGGVIESVNVRTVSRRSTQVSTEKRIEMAVTFELFNRDGYLLSSGRVSENQVYPETGNRSATDAARLNAVRWISQKVAEQVRHRLCENF
jgi:outer membrane lipopolysaccharide assembly protein LptE/RlpB